jgi:lambda family phage portal protein
MAAGSTILTNWRAGQERVRREQAAHREMQQAMAAFRTHTGRAMPRRAVVPQKPVEPAFAHVSGQRAFSAAGYDRLAAGWVSHNSGINADLEGQLSVLIARSRDWCVNTDIGRRYIQLVKDNVVGATGARLQVRAKLNMQAEALDELGNATIERHWLRWCRRGACDVTGQLSFVDICRLVVAQAARDGGYLTRQVRSRSLEYGYALQVLDIDRLQVNNNAAAGAAAGNTIRMGIEVAPFGVPVAYHLQGSHPGDAHSLMGSQAGVRRVLAGDVLHGFVAERPEQLRGYPWTAAVLRRANTLDSYEQYAVQAAKIGAAKMGFYTIDKDAPADAMEVSDYKDATGNLVQDVEAGMLEALPPGVGFESFNPDYPHQNFDSFVTACLHGVSAGLNVAHHNLTGNMTGVNYSSARIAELSERQHWMGLQNWLIESFVRPVFEAWLESALIKGAITLPSGKALPAETFAKWADAATFQPRRWAWVDPQKDITAAVTAIDNKLRSHRSVADEQGVDLDDVLDDEARFQQQLKDKGLSVTKPASPASKPVDPEADDEENNTTPPQEDAP